MLSRNVLVLNQNYEPLSVCTVKRAVVLIYLGKAEIIEKHNGKMVRSVSWSSPVPSVVRLGFYIRVPQKRILLTRKNIIKRDDQNPSDPTISRLFNISLVSQITGGSNIYS